MKRFLLLLLMILGIPLLLLMGLFLYSDPFRTLHPFDVDDIDGTNREYQSTELFLQNKDKYNYNSFVFSSSRGCYINLYTWKMFINDSTVQPFLFQAWAETITGIEMKIEYLTENQIPLNNVLILLDIPSTFAKDQLPCNAMSIKHPMFTHRPKWAYNLALFYNYCQKPSHWIESFKGKLANKQVSICSDTITNDWNAYNHFTYAEFPPMDSLKECSDMTRRTFFEKIKNKSEKDIVMSSELLNAQFKQQLIHIKKMLDDNNTNYHLIITPGYCYTSDYINDQDLYELESIFEKDRVHDFTRHYITQDYNYFSDPGHFGLRAGYIMLEEIYSPRSLNE